MDVPGASPLPLPQPPGAMSLKKVFNPDRDPWSEILDFCRAIDSIDSNDRNGPGPTEVPGISSWGRHSGGVQPRERLTQ
jgi:hypothetical protein